MFGKKNRPFLIAEVSSNHNGSFVNAKKLIKAAKDYGADAVKLQTYTPASMTVNSKKKYFQVKNGLWKNYNLWKLYKKAQTPYHWHKKLFQYAKSLNIKIFSTPFDENAVNFLEKLNSPFYKIASFEMTDLPLIKKVAATGKPIIISTGMASLDEISQSFNEAKKYGAKKITLLYCVSNYPSKISDFNLNNIKILKKKFKCEVGFSDHSNDFRIASTAVKLGATVVEKHISLENVKALDSDFSISGERIFQYKKAINNFSRIPKNKFYTKLLGKKKFFRNKSEQKSKVFRRSIFVVKKIAAGDIFNKSNIRKIRPGFGVSPSYYEKILGRKCSFDINANEPLMIKMLPNFWGSK
jgi:pseudaminic acid synthase